MKSSVAFGYLAASLSVASLCMMGAGANYPFAWLIITALLVLGAAINFGVFDSRIGAVIRGIRLLACIGICVSVLTILRDRGESESLALTLSGFIVGLILLCTVTEPRFREKGNH